MESKKFCQSCAMPLDKPEDFGTNADGCKNEDYCQYCFENGAFKADCTMDEMIEFCVPHMISANPSMSEDEIRNQMKMFFPALKRWSQSQGEGHSNMSNAVMYISFKLVEGASVPDFLFTAEKLNNEHMSKQKGYISWKQLKEGDMWVDLCTWETMDDARKAMEASGSPDALAGKYYSFLDQGSIKMHLFSVEKSY